MSNSQKNNYLSDKVTKWMYLFYILCTIITSIFIRESDITTLLIPVIFYTAVSIVIRNSKQSDTMEKVSNDINELLLISFVIVYIPVKIYLKSIEKFLEVDQSDCANTLFNVIKLIIIFLFGIVIIFAILFFVTKGLSKKLNNKSHYHNFENDNKGGLNVGARRTKRARIKNNCLNHYYSINNQMRQLRNKDK